MSEKPQDFTRPQGVIKIFGKKESADLPVEAEAEHAVEEQVTPTKRRIVFGSGRTVSRTHSVEELAGSQAGVDTLFRINGTEHGQEKNDHLNVGLSKEEVGLSTEKDEDTFQWSMESHDAIHTADAEPSALDMEPPEADPAEPRKETFKEPFSGHQAGQVSGLIALAESVLKAGTNPSVAAEPVQPQTVTPLQPIQTVQSVQSVQKRVVEVLPEEPPLPNPLEAEPTLDLWHLLDMKAEEFHILGYGLTSSRDLWEYFKMEKKRRPRNLHELVGAILSLQPQAFMNHMMKRSYEPVSLDDLSELLRR